VIQCDVAVPWTASVAAWCLCGGGHCGGGGDDDDGDNSGSGNNDARGHIPKAGCNEMTACDDDEESVGAHESASLTGLIKSLGEGRGAQSVLSAVANAPVSPVSPDSPGLAVTVVNRDTDVGNVETLGVDTHGQGGVLPVVGAALAMAEGTAGIGSAGGAEKPPLQHPRRWSARRMGRQGVGAKGHHKSRPGIELRHRHGRASECSMSRKESDRVRVTHELRTAEGGTCRCTERKRPSDDSPPGDCRERDTPGHRTKATSRGAQGGDRRGKDLSGHRKKAIE